ncbi:MAG: alpha-glucosidase/alpha-galactosidase [Defluviitaleaceae bacterium]|nr:alpha-glucosidase/alpha-galactosidase [Defluviitaleaceae bacterium]
MKYKNEKVSDIKIAYIGGGSRGWAWSFMGDLTQEKDISGTIALYDIDKEAAEQNETLGNMLNKKEDGNWVYKAVETLPQALLGADFIVISILPGTFDEMHSDVHTPERHGIYQSVGDTAGPGGIIRSLRTIPMFVDIANAIKEHAPTAWVINYTNPMSICMKTLYHTFPEIKAFGCCHEVFGTQTLLRDIVKQTFDLQNVSRSDIKVNVLGINHFTWFDYASYKGIDLFPVYRQFIDKNFENGYNEKEEHWANSSFASMNRVKFDLFLKYGYIAAAGDRHLAEFLPSEIYLKDPKTVESWSFGLTTVDWRKNDLKERVKRGKRLVSGEDELEIKPSGEEGILLIKALCGLGQIISNVNIPNTYGQITNLEKDAIVETNAVFERDFIRPIAVGSLPKSIYDMTVPHVQNHKLILEAALTHTVVPVVQAFKNDPLINNKISESEIEALVNDMIKNTAKFLPQPWQQI